MGAVQGLDALVALFAERPGEQPIGHHVTNVVATEHDDGTVRVRSKGLAVMADGTASTVVYDDVVVHTPSGWRISHRTVIPAHID